MKGHIIFTKTLNRTTFHFLKAINAIKKLNFEGVYTNNSTTLQLIILVNMNILRCKYKCPNSLRVGECTKYDFKYECPNSIRVAECTKYEHS